MKSKFLIGLLMSLLCGFYSAAQSPGIGNANSYQPMSKLGLQMSYITNPNDLKQMYDTIKHDYERRSFIHELPGYFSAKGITSIPGWVNNSIVSCFDSSNANLLNESIIAAGAFKIPCGARLMAIYNEAPSKYGHHSEQIRTAIIHALRQIHDPNNSQFFYTFLTKGNIYLLGGQFEELLMGMNENRSPSYIPKLNDCASRLTTLQAKIEKNKGPGIENVRKILGEVIALQKKIALDQAAVNGGSK